MNDQQDSTQSATRPGAGAAPSAPSLPDLNAGKNPFELVQKLIDRTAWINMFAAPDSKQSGAAIRTAGKQDGVIGIRGSMVLRRFDIDLQLPSREGGVRAVNTVGQAAGRFDLRWMVIPYNFEARPDREPPPTLLDPTQAQRVAMQEGTFTFGEGKDGFRSFRDRAHVSDRGGGTTAACCSSDRQHRRGVRQIQGA